MSTPSGTGSTSSAPRTTRAGGLGAGARGDTWTPAWHAVGHRLSGLLEHPDPVTPDTLPLAVVSHAATVRLLVTVHRDLTHRAPRTTGKELGAHAAPAPLELLDTDPVKALGHALDRHPATPGAALSDVLTTNPPPGPARLWHDIARAATLAEHTWRTAEPTSRPHRDQAWSVMADVAAIGESLAILDHDLARTATRLTPTGAELLNVSPGVLSDRYGYAATAGLRAAGERTRLLAARGPLPDVGPLRQPTTTAHAVRQPAHVPAAQTSLVELLNQARTISPRDLTVLAVAQAKISEHAARLTTDPGLATTAREHTAVLATVKPRDVVTLEPDSDPRPLQQTQALLTYLRDVRAGSPGASRVAAALARSQPDVVDALHRAARDQLANGAWLIPDDRPRTTTQWMKQPASRGTGPTTQPHLVDRLVAARTSAHRLAQAAGTNPFPDTDAALAVATARQGLPPREAITTPAFPAATTRPAAPGHTLARHARTGPSRGSGPESGVER